MWRDSDEAWLTRLECEELLEPLFAQAGGTRAPRCLGLLASLKAQDAETFERAVDGDTAAREQLVVRLDAVEGDAARLHGIGLWHLARCSQLEGPRSVAAGLRAVAAFFALGEEREYVSALVRDVVDGALPDTELARNVADARWVGLENVGAWARDGAGDRGTQAGAALGVIVRVEEACELARVPSEARPEIRARAARLRHEILDAAFARCRAADTEATRDDAPEARNAAVLEMLEVWRWSGELEDAERVVFDHAVALGWEHYRATRWDLLAALVGGLGPLVDRHARRIAADPSHIAYASACAQLLVFHAEVAPSFAEQVAYAERALAVCPSHRNARVVLAGFLCERAIRRSDAPLFRLDAEAVLAARKDVERAGYLHPECGALARARERVA